MNCICEQFNCVKNFKDKFILTEDNVLINVIQKTIKIGIAILINVYPHIINMSSYYLSRMTNLRVFSIAVLLLSALLRLAHYDKSIHHDKWLDTALYMVVMTTNFIGSFDLAGVFPIERECRVAIDCLLLLVSVIGSSRAIYEGTNRMISSVSVKEKRTTSKISEFISGAALTTIGAISFGNSLNQAFSWASGFKKLQDLDSVQMKAVFKHRAIAEQSKNFECTAVIIDGMGMNRDHIERIAVPFAEELYRNCKTRSYIVNSDGQFCNALESARVHFGAPVDILSLQGHANNKLQLLGDNYAFSGNQKEITCMKETLSPDAQIVLLGCNTATITPDVQTTLLDKVSKGLPEKTVTGFNGFYNMWLTTTSWINNRFIHENYIPYNLNGFTYLRTSRVAKSI